MTTPHYEVWDGRCDEVGLDAEFVETAMSFDEAKVIRDLHRKDGAHYAFIRDMNEGGKVVYE